MGATEDFKDLYKDINWGLLTNCTRWCIDPSIDWENTDTLMYERHQFQELLEYLTKTQGWTPTLMMERGYIMEVMFDLNHQLLELSNLALGKPHKIRVYFDTEFGRVYLSYYSNTYQRDTHWDIHFDY